VDRSKIGKKSRNKGQRGERLLVKKFQEWWGSEFFRTPGSGSFATRGFSRKSMDVAGDIVTLDEAFPFCVESKNAEGWLLAHLLSNPTQGLLAKWWEQAVTQCPVDRTPLLVFTRNHQPTYFMIAAELIGPEFTGARLTTCVNGVPVVVGLLSDLFVVPPMVFSRVKLKLKLTPLALEEARKPQPPEELVGALQYRVPVDVGRARPGRTARRSVSK